MHDTPTFGSFMNSVMTAVRDDFGKLPLMAWPLLSDASSEFQLVDVSIRGKKVHDTHLGPDQTRGPETD
jgi:hypothetical protein